MSISIHSISGSSQSIGVSGSSATNSINISNIGDFYKLAKDWAIKMNGLVENTDYSAKYYAQQAENSKNSLLNNSGFIAVSSDLTGDNNIGTVADSISNVNAVGANINSVITVAGMDSNIASVLANATNINTTATNIVAIQNASTNAQTATTKASEAQIWAEGTDLQVQALGGTHSAKKWSELSYFTIRKWY